jgi:hypothetical protein
MKRLASLTSVIAATVLTAGLMAQGKANFAGKWQQVDPDPAAAAGGGGRGRGGGGWGQTPTITQDASNLTVEYMGGGQNPTATKFIVKLDGTDSKNSQSFGGNTMESVSKAVWEGSKLVITTTQEFNGNKFETKRALSLEGGNLVIETTSPGRQGGAATTTKVTYKKAS